MDRDSLTSVKLSKCDVFFFPLLRLLPQLTPGPFNETPTRSVETDTTNKRNNTTKSAPKVTGGPKEDPVTKAKKSRKREMGINKNVRSLLVKLTAEDHDTFCFDI